MSSLFHLGEVVPTQLQNIGDTLLGPFNRTKWNQKRTTLPPDYQPGDWDVYCGRGKCNWNHKGNIRFRNLIQSNVQRYIESPSRNDKTLVVISIVDYVRDRQGHFIKQEKSGEWYDIGDAQARDKVGHSLRDQVTALQRQRKNKDIFRKNKPGNVERHISSSLSDSGNEADLRKSTNTTSSQVRNLFERRPSFIIDSYQNYDSSQKRASILVSGDEEATTKVNSMRRSTNWEFLGSLQDILDQVDNYNIIEGIDHLDQQLYMDDAPMRLSETVGTIEPFSIRDSGTTGIPPERRRDSMFDDVPYGDFVSSVASMDEV